MREVTTVGDAHSYVRKNAAMFFRSGHPTARECSTNLVSDALILGATEVAVIRLGYWWVVGANLDWLANTDIDESDLFRRVVPFTEAGVNSMRSEVVVGAFADAVVVVGQQDLIQVMGPHSEEPVGVRDLFVQKQWVRAVAFKFPRE